MIKNRKKKLLIALTLMLAVFTVWTVWGNITIGTTYYSISSNRIPAAFNDYRIAQISDLHNATFGKENQKITDIIEKEKPDIIVLTGDLVDSRRTDVEVPVALVEKLMKKAPCYYVTGNHESRIVSDYLKLEEGLLKAGVVVLHDEVVKLEKQGQSIQLAGLDDPDFMDRDPAVQPAMLQVKIRQLELSDDYCILLSHRPEAFESYASEKIDLVFSGHAHGGQFRLPFIGGLIAPHQGLFPKYDGGLYTKDNTNMIVSRGVGNSLFPFRINNRPEIIIATLKTAGN